MPYKITIERIETVAVMKHGEYTVIDRVPWTDAELTSKTENNLYGKSYSQLIEKEPLREIRNYAPDRQVSELKNTQILNQTVEALDLIAVIKAINGI